MIVVEVLLATNLAVLALLVLTDRSRQRRMRTVDVLSPRRPTKASAGSSRPTIGRTPACGGGVVIPIDRAVRRAREAAMARHPAGMHTARPHSTTRH